MYSVKQFNKVVSSFKPILDKHFYASTKQSSESILHFSYRLLDLQKEIEKRTFYLGKYRKTEEAAHLMDLIGMSRDEGDLLYPFAQEAMANVYDQLNLSTQHISKNYEWKDPKEPIEIKLTKDMFGTRGKIISAGSSRIESNVTLDNKNGYITFAGEITFQLDIKEGGNSVLNQLKGNPNKYVFETSVGVTYTTRYKITGTNTYINTRKTITIPLPNLIISDVDIEAGEITVYSTPQRVKIDLQPQGEFTTQEELVSIESSMLLDQNDDLRLLLADPKKLNEGDCVKYEGVYYEIIKDTDENGFNVGVNAVAVDESETMVEGIHYYLSVPNYLNLTTVAPLDNAIKEALVNRIIWKWLVLSYPTEAATYDTLYQDNLKSIAMRCNIFNKHWQQVPRIL
jgi:hypothetical protein